MAELQLPFAVALPFLAAFAALATGRALGRTTGLWMLAAAGGAFAIVASAFGEAGSAPLVFSRDWIPTLGLEVRFRADGFGSFFALLVSGIGSLVAIYAISYLPELPRARLGRFFAALSAFMGAMLGIALADDLLLLFVFWEITSITSFLLIGFWYEDEKARHGALTALQVTALGGLSMMVGFVIIGSAAGTFRLSTIVGDPVVRATVADSPLFVPALLFVLGGVFTKSAQVPFHFWLPGAMVAPTPVSTYLHAATMVKAGVFLLGRVTPLFAASALWSPILVTFGLATFVLGAAQAFVAHDLKAILARTTLSTLGLVTLVYGLGAADQDALQLFSHAAYKGALFLVAGIVEHATGTRDLRRLGGLRDSLPITFAIAVVAAASMAGIPPLFGFLAKEAFYAAILDSAAIGGVPGLRWLIVLAAVGANALVLATALTFIKGVFLGEKPHRSKDDGDHAGAHGHDEHGHGSHESPALWLSPALLATVALLVGLLGATGFTEDLVRRFSSEPQSHLHVSLLPTHVGPLLLTLVTIALGIVLYRIRQAAVDLGTALVTTTMQERWDALLHGIADAATWFADHWQTGSVRWYFSAVLATFVALVAVALERHGLSLEQVRPDFSNLTFYGVSLCCLLIAATITVVRAQTRLAAALSLTAVGFFVSLLYVVYRSPDILLTQILIETVSTIFVLLVLFFLPVFRADGLRATETAWNGAVSIAVGIVVFVMSALATSPGFRETRKIADDYLSRALTEAGGANAVNVIIVDFRALDTTGEITVLVVVGLCVYGLLRARRGTA